MGELWRRNILSSINSVCVGFNLWLKSFWNFPYQLFLERERAAQLAESQTDELIKEAPTAQHDKSGDWQETSGEIQWVSTEKSDSTEEKDKKEEDDEELDLNKGMLEGLDELRKRQELCDGVNS